MVDPTNRLSAAVEQQNELLERQIAVEQKRVEAIQDLTTAIRRLTNFV